MLYAMAVTTLPDLLEKQLNVVARRQLLRLGMTDRMLHSRVREGGHWQILLPGVYLTVTGTPTNTPPGLSELTPRELEIFKLLASGLSNAEIADQLVLAGATVKTHVTRILTKLSLRDRVQAVVLAYETGIIRPGTPR